MIRAKEARRMVSFFSTVATRVSRLGRRLTGPIFIFFVACDVALFGFVELHRSEMQSGIERQMKADIDQENHAVCAELGLASGDAFGTCSKELSLVRQRHEERLESEAPF
ncbi:MAG TPA: hypothetical protein VGF92_21685 [Stellaceae bacterium]|jgi:hypothetical protein